MSNFARSSAAASRPSFSAVCGGRGTAAAGAAGVVVVAELLLQPNSGDSSPRRGGGPGGGVDGASGPECAGVPTAGLVEALSLERRKSGMRGDAGDFADLFRGCGALPALPALLLLAPRA